MPNGNGKWGNWKVVYELQSQFEYAKQYHKELVSKPKQRKKKEHGSQKPDRKALKKIRQKVILESLRHGATKTAACKTAGINFSTLWRWMQVEEFAQQVHEAEWGMVAFVEDVLYKKAVDGVPSCIFFLLCNRAPDRWHSIQKAEVKHTGTVDHAHKGNVDYSQRETGELEELLSALRRAKADRARVADRG